jgi:hypothetical protein
VLAAGQVIAEDFQRLGEPGTGFVLLEGQLGMLVELAVERLD